MRSTVPARNQHVDSLETTIIQLSQRGVTTRQIAELIEQMYGHELLESSYACGKPPGATFRPEGRPGCA